MTGTLSIPSAGQPNASEDPKTATALTTLNSLLTSSNLLDGAQLGAGTVPNGALSSTLALPNTKLDPVTVAAPLGLNDGTSVRRGKSIIATAESTTATSYAITNLATPDRVQNVVLPTDGLLVIGYHALAKSTTANGSIAIFVGANQLKRPAVDGVPVVQEVATAGAFYSHIATDRSGLVRDNSPTADSSDVTTGQILGVPTASVGGGLCTVFAAAGTYDISVQFKAAVSGTIFAQSRKLWVWAIGF
jgi:hypothetical protein